MHVEVELVISILGVLVMTSEYPRGCRCSATGHSAQTGDPAGDGGTAFRTFVVAQVLIGRGTIGTAWITGPGVLLPGLAGFLLPASRRDDVLQLVPFNAAMSFSSVHGDPTMLDVGAGAVVVAVA